MLYSYHKLTDLKNRASQIARAENLSRHVALDVAARRGGFQNYANARTQLADKVATGRETVEIRQRWRDNGLQRAGVASFRVSLATPLAALIRPHHLAGYLGGCEVREPSVLLSDGFMRDREDTRIDFGKIARALQFMEVTGLKPSRARRLYPKGRWENRPPIADHDHGWFDPEARVHLLSTEPYREHAEHSAEQKIWEQRHGWATLPVKWGSIYGFSTSLYLLCPEYYAPTLLSKIDALEGSRPAIRTDSISIDLGWPLRKLAPAARSSV